jgi:hypothetical protein
MLFPVIWVPETLVALMPKLLEVPRVVMLFVLMVVLFVPVKTSIPLLVPAEPFVEIELFSMVALWPETETPMPLSMTEMLLPIIWLRRLVVVDIEIAVSLLTRVLLRTRRSAELKMLKPLLTFISIFPV